MKSFYVVCKFSFLLIAVFAIGSSFFPQVAISEAAFNSFRVDAVILSGDGLAVLKNPKSADFGLSDLTLAAGSDSCENSDCPATKEVNFEKQVTLTSHDGTISVSGILLDIVDGAFVVEVENLGRVEIKAESAVCEGPGCPIPEVMEPVQIVGNDYMALAIAPHLLIGFGEQKSAASGFHLLDLNSFEVTYTNAADEDLGTARVRPDAIGNALKSLASQSADFAIVPRRLGDVEVAEMLQNNIDDPRGTNRETSIGFDAARVILHPSNPLQELEIGDLTKIYSGEITDWGELGGTEGVIKVLYPEQGSGLSEVLNRAFFKHSSTNSRAPYALTVKLRSDMVKEVRHDPSAIGFSAISENVGVKAVGLVGSCGLEYHASPFAIKSEDYPLAQRMFIYSRAQETLPALVNELVQYVASSAVDFAIDASGHVSSEIERRPQRVSDINLVGDDQIEGADRALVEQLARDLEQFDRLSTTVRFSGQVREFQSKDILELDRLVQYLGDLPSGTKVAVVGFFGDENTLAENASLSVEWANSVSEAIQSAGEELLSHLEFVNRGYGELSPIACNTDDLGRELNRRVEIWVSDSSDGGQ